MALSRGGRARTHIRRTVRTGLSGRVLWGVADQGLFGLTSFAVSVGVANQAAPPVFGAFGIAYVVYTLILGAVQSFTAEVVVVRGSHLPPAERQAMLSSAAGTALLCGVACSVVGFAFLLFGSGVTSQVVPPLFIPAPLLFIQDVWRFGFFAGARPRSAALNDLLWALLMAVGFSLILLNSRHAWLGLEWCWSGAGAVCGLVGALQARCLPRPGALVSWVRHQTRAGGRFAGEYLATNGAGQGVLIWVGLFAGLSQSAGYRGATLLFGPIQITLNSVRLAVIPIVVRAHEAGRQNAAWRGGATVALCAVALTSLWGVILLLLPNTVGRHLLGHSWSATQPVIPVFFWLTLTQSVGLGALVLLRVVGAYRQTFRIRMGGALLILVFGAAGATGGSVPAGIGASLASTIAVCALWWQGRSFRGAAML